MQSLETSAQREEVENGTAKNPLAQTNEDMMKRVRSTAKWSQLYKSGSSFPPKHKVLYINQDEDQQPKEAVQGRVVKQQEKPKTAGDNANGALSNTYIDNVINSAKRVSNSPGTRNNSQFVMSEKKNVKVF